MIDWKETRKQYPLANEYTYLNSARFGPLSQSSLTIKKEYLDHLNTHGSWNFERWIEDYENARSLSAQLLGVDSENVFFLPNLSTGVNMARQHLPKLPVVLLKGDFPSVTLPWSGHQVAELDYLADDLYGQIEKLLQKERSILCISWIQSFDGFIVGLEQIYHLCRKYGSILILDTTQGLGIMPFQIPKDIDMIMIASGFKHLLAGYGVAVGYASDGLLRDLKSFTGWNSIDHGKGAAKTGAASLEVGNAMFENVLSLNESLKEILAIGIEEIHSRMIQISHHLKNKMDTVNFCPHIHRIEIESDVYSELITEKIQVTDQGSKIRVSLGLYSQAPDLDRLCNVITRS